MSSPARALMLVVSLGLAGCAVAGDGDFEEIPSEPTAVVDEDIAYLDGLLRQGIIDGIEHFTDSTGRPRFKFLLSYQQSASNAFDERYFRKGWGNLILQPGVRPSEALDALYAEPERYGFECATAISILHYTGIRDAFLQLTGSDELFDATFADMKIGRLELGLSVELLRGGRTHHTGALAVGDHGYFRNADVAESYRALGWNGENVIYLGDDRYFGHPFGVTDSETIINYLNSVRRTDISNPRAAVLDPGGYYLDAGYLWRLVDAWMQRPLDTGLFYQSNNEHVEIPDAADEGVATSIESTIGGRVSLVTVIVELDHDRPGDLAIDLFHGDSAVRLHDHEDVSGQLKIQLTTDAGDLHQFLGDDARGAWVLTATDVRSGSVGAIARWSLSLVSE